VDPDPVGPVLYLFLARSDPDLRSNFYYLYNLWRVPVPYIFINLLKSDQIPVRRDCINISLSVTQSGVEQSRS
jgi:hypothetical protein